MKTKKAGPDFFTRYNIDRFKKNQMYGFAGIIALFLAFIINVVGRSDISTQNMMASVTNLTQEQKEYPADLVLETHSGSFVFVF